MAKNSITKEDEAKGTGSDTNGGKVVLELIESTLNTVDIAKKWEVGEGRD
jgi:hypothetical protein